MTREKLVRFFIFLLMFFEGNYFLSIKQIGVTESVLNKTKLVQLDNETLVASGSLSRSTECKSSLPSLIFQGSTTISSEFNTTGINSTNLKQSELTEIFDEVSNNANNTNETTVSNITIKDCVNISSVNSTCVEPSWNETGKTNYTLIAEAANSLNSEDPTMRVERLTAFAAGVFLVSAVIGYLSCVGYRRLLQLKYGNSQVLIPEEVYDTTDLRYFEI